MEDVNGERIQKIKIESVRKQSPTFWLGNSGRSNFIDPHGGTFPVANAGGEM
jgi:hypothetical protein